MSKPFIHESSYVDDDVIIGEDTKIWHFCHIQRGARIGSRCSFGQNVNVGNNVRIGNGVRIQNNVSVYEGVEIEDNVFCGPSCVFTNGTTPRAPARRIGWVCECGNRLDDSLVCSCGRHYHLNNDALLEQD